MESETVEHISGKLGPLGKKLGPLPLWAWGAVVIGAIVVVKLMGKAGLGSGGTAGPFATAPSGDAGGGGMGSDFGDAAAAPVAAGAGTAGAGSTSAGSAAGGSAGASAGSVSVPDSTLMAPLAAPTGEIGTPIMSYAPAGPGSGLSITTSPAVSIGSASPSRATQTMPSPTAGNVGVVPVALKPTATQTSIVNAQTGFVTGGKAQPKQTPIVNAQTGFVTGTRPLGESRVPGFNNYVKPPTKPATTKPAAVTVSSAGKKMPSATI